MSDLLLNHKKVEDLTEVERNRFLSSVGYKYYLENYSSKHQDFLTGLNQYLELRFYIAIELLNNVKFIDLSRPDLGISSLGETKWESDI